MKIPRTPARGQRPHARGSAAGINCWTLTEATVDLPAHLTSGQMQPQEWVWVKPAEDPAQLTQRMGRKRFAFLSHQDVGWFLSVGKG